MRRRTAVVLWVTLAAIVVATLTTTVVVGTARSRERAAALAATTATVEQNLPRLEAFVAQRTGRPWTSSVTPEVLDDAAFTEALHNGPNTATVPTDDDDDLGVTLAAMGLVSTPDAFWHATDTSYDTNVVGFYDDSTKRLVVRGDAWTPALEDTLVHELTHANQDQSFDLGGLWKATRTDDESATALRAVIEGEASLVELDFFDAQTPAWQAPVRSTGGSASPLPIVDTLAAFPYQAGEQFVRTVRESGGTAAVSRMFAHPPLWSRDLFRPRQWLAGTLPAVRRPGFPASPTGSKDDVADYGVLGVEGLWVTVQGDSPDARTASALDGWTGDAYVATENADADTWCFVDDVTFATATARDKAATFLAPWLTSSGTVLTPQTPTSFRLHRCS
jgi:hypothetical protein